MKTSLPISSRVIQQVNIEPSGYPKWTRILFYIIALYLVLPIIDIPLLGLSLSAPILFLVAIPCILKPPKPWFFAYRRWILLAILIWVGIFFAAVLNGLLSGGIKVDKSSLISLIQYAYWFLSFVVTAYFVASQKNLASRLVNVIAIGITILALLRWGEAIFGGAIGAWMHLGIMTENDYAFQFSIFYPVLLGFAFWGSHRLLAALAVLALWGAVLINGSRTGWITVLFSTILFLWMYLRTQHQRVRAIFILFLLMIMLGVGAFLMPNDVVSSFGQRLSTFQKLDQDKSYAIRQLMDQKGLRFFQSSPWIGIGVSRWAKESVPLDIPLVLQYASQSHFDVKSSHNSYISFLAEDGLVGAIPFGLLLLVLAVRGYKVASNLAARGEVWALGVYAGFIGMSIHLWTLSGLTGTVTWFMYGLVAAMIELDRQAIGIMEHQGLNAPRFSLSHPRNF